MPNPELVRLARLAASGEGGLFGWAIDDGPERRPFGWHPPEEVALVERIAACWPTRSAALQFARGVLIDEGYRWPRLPRDLFCLVERFPDLAAQIADVEAQRIVPTYTRK